MAPIVRPVDPCYTSGYALARAASFRHSVITEGTRAAVFTLAGSNTLAERANSAQREHTKGTLPVPARTAAP